MAESLALMPMLRYNLAANCVGQVTTVVLSIVTVPMYARYLGIEAYGLITFNAVLMAWMQVLDFGLTPTLCREMAGLQSGRSASRDVALLLVSLEKVVLGVSIVLITLAFAGSGFIADRWFDQRQLSGSDVQVAFVLMVAAVSVRWVGSLYKGAIVGLARQVELNAITIVFTLLRTVAAIPLIAGIPSIQVFFVYQLVITAVEAAALRCFLGKRVGVSPFVRDFSSHALRLRARLSLSLAFSSLVWASITQVDRIILSKLLPLNAYGAFGMATLLAGGILLLSAPIHQALIPHFAVEHDSGDPHALAHTYYFATEITLLVVLPVAVVFACLPGSVFRLWSATVPADATARFTLACYAVGNACTAVTALSYLLQYTKGDLSLHVKGNVGFLLVLVPLIFIGVRVAAVRGVGTVWVASNVVFLLGWVALVHRRFLPGINKRWYCWLAMRAGLVGAIGILLSRADFSELSRVALFFALFGCWFLLVLVALAMSPITQQKARALVGEVIDRRFGRGSRSPAVRHRTKDV